MLTGFKREDEVTGEGLYFTTFTQAKEETLPAPS